MVNDASAILIPRGLDPTGIRLIGGAAAQHYQGDEPEGCCMSDGRCYGRRGAGRYATKSSATLCIPPVTA
jgi:hypothetical protein